jgi:hypothetical protein
MAKDKKDRPPVGPDTEYSRKRQDNYLIHNETVVK